MADDRSNVSGDEPDESTAEHDAAEKERERENKTKKSGNPEPKWTKTGPIVAPKFGSAGSGGAEYDPGPERP